LIYYTVFDANGKKIADCGNEKDAKWLSDCHDGTYKTNRLDWYETVDVKLSRLDLPSIGIGGQELPVQQKLPESQTEIFIPDFHD
jgi:hypothetical protein